MIRKLLFRLALVVVIAVLWLGTLEHFNPTPPAMIVEAHSVPFTRASGTFSKWRPLAPQDSHLFAPCPVTPWALPKHVEEHIE
jgi:hypothetical protein